MSALYLAISLAYAAPFMARTSNSGELLTYLDYKNDLLHLCLDT